MNSTFLILLLLTILSKGFGFFRETILAYYFGTSGIVDIFILSTAIPSVIFGCLNAISVSIVPIYTRAELKGEVYANHVLNNIISWVLILSGMIILVSESILPGIISIMFPTLSEYYMGKLTVFTRFTILTVAFNPITQILLSYLRIKNKFSMAAFIELFISIVQILFIILAGLNKYSLFLAIGYLCSHIVCTIFSVLLTKVIGLKFKLDFNYTNNIQDAILTMIPIFISTIIVQLNALIDKIFASHLTQGAISALGYSNTVKNLIYSLFPTILITIYYPKISRLIAHEKWKKCIEKMNIYIHFLIIITLPCIIFSMYHSDEIISVIYKRGAFDEQSCLMTSGAFAMYCIGLLPISIREIILRYYYSLKQGSIIVLLSLSSILLNIALNFCLIDVFSYKGLALATSLSAILTLPLYFHKLPKVNRLNQIQIFIVFIISISEIFIALFISSKIFSLLNLSGYGPLNLFLKLLLEGIVMYIIYSALCFLTCYYNKTLRISILEMFKINSLVKCQSKNNI